MQQLVHNNNIISQLKFKGCWRSYQQRVLDELEYHLDDNKLNVVAAPGAGKTTLGIEVILRLKNPAFILAPTITIKNQWKQRILDNFLPSDFNSDLISTDIKSISEITVSTYQGLHSIYKNIEEREKFIKQLKDLNINTLVLDEAHHLRTEWWATLNSLYKELNNKNFKIVSLTGTPPYDVSPAEWNNYQSLCGAVDAEISIPELVKAGDLCPHQDLIYFSNLTEEEQKIIFNFEEKRNAFFKDINEHSDILYAIEGSPFITNLDSNVDIIYKNTNFTIAIISYLLHEDELNMNARILTEFLGLTLKQIPKFDYEQAEILFNGIIGEFSEQFKNVPIIKGKLKEYSLINAKKADFTGKVDFKKLFARSKNKLEAIYNITDFEFKNLENQLREVILLDYIGKGDSEGVNILSVFDKLQDIKTNCGILTGSLIVIPKTAKEELYSILNNRNIESSKVLTTEFNENYVRVETYGNIDIVSIITELFENGYMNILIGTSALLGEGWDSPCVNTLIIASIVGSFMLSNQMRGRALRIDKNNPNKTSNIWHLVSLTNNEQSSDLQTAEKRFNTFEGISYKDNKIQNGMERLGIKQKDICSLNCETIDKKIMNYAKNRNDLRNKWNQVFGKSNIIESKMAPQVYDVMLGENTQQTIICNIIPTWCNGLIPVIENCSTSRKKVNLNYIEKLFLKICHHFNFISDDYENIISNNYLIYEQENNLKNLAQSLLYTMCDLSIIKTNFDNMNLVINTKLNSKFYITLFGCNNYERNIFMNAFSEIFAINDKNRYILKQGEKYIAVPECIAGHNKNVKTFVKYLEQNNGYFDIIYTRNPNGYKELLKAKFNILDYGFLKQSRVWI